MLELNRVCKYFGGLAALKDISFTVKEGEFAGLIGPNGSGKTTLFNVITGALKATTGKLSFMGKEITGLTPDEICHTGIARTFQIPKPFPSLCVFDNIKAGVLFGKDNSCSDIEANEETARLIQFAGLSKYRLAMPGELNVVNLRSLEVARALATKPRLLLLDEIGSGLTQAELSEASDRLGRIREEMGITIIWIEHIMSALMNLVERVVVLEYGQVIADGEPSEISQDEKVIEAYLGKD